MHLNYYRFRNFAGALFIVAFFFVIGCSKKSTPTPPVDNTPKVTITALSVTEGPYNTSVKITGTGFTATVNEQVFFNGKEAEIYTGSENQIIVYVPLAAGTGKVTVKVNGVTATGPVFNYQVAQVVTTLAGNLQPGNVNGVGSAAKFNDPFGIAIDANGNIFVAEDGNNDIRKITPDGTVSTFAGSGAQGNKDGTGLGATFNGPSGLAIDKSGNIYVADQSNSLIRKITPEGVVTTFAGDGLPHNNNGQGTTASFDQPYGIAVGPDDNIYVADMQNSLIRKITPGGLVSTLAGSGFFGFGDGTGTHADFAQPSGIAFDAAGNLFISDRGTSLIRKVAPGAIVTRLAGGIPGLVNGAALSAGFTIPQGLAVDAAGNIYVADTGNDVIRKIDTNGQVTTFAGAPNPIGITNGILTKATFRSPKGVAIDKAGNIYVADAGSGRIRKITNE